MEMDQVAGDSDLIHNHKSNIYPDDKLNEIQIPIKSGFIGTGSAHTKYNP